ncbi:MAG: hypothetical protein AUG80_04180 [Candidatus Rokubacteria bacterium 13_1_20CM_4_68_9]|nr:MAG: hypothetical protein AUG80_04180 [Candidatus Rokubacteria bacterium 13_1_20CM_4_68_9]
MRVLAIVLLAVAVGGCAAELDVSGEKWRKEGIGSNQVTLDETECARSAMDAGQTPDLIVGGLADVVDPGSRWNSSRGDGAHDPSSDRAKRHFGMGGHGASR